MNLLNTICELSRAGITTYGGHYDFYTAQKKMENKALDQEVQRTEKKLRQARQKEREQVGGDTAKQRSEKFGRFLQDRKSLSVNRHDTSITSSKQLELALPASRIASLSSGAFVGMVADNPEEKITLKAFCADIMNNHRQLAGKQKLP